MAYPTICAIALNMLLPFCTNMYINVYIYVCVCVRVVLE